MHYKERTYNKLWIGGKLTSAFPQWKPEIMLKIVIALSHSPVLKSEDGKDGHYSNNWSPWGGSIKWNIMELLLHSFQQQEHLESIRYPNVYGSQWICLLFHTFSRRDYSFSLSFACFSWGSTFAAKYSWLVQSRPCSEEVLLLNSGIGPLLKCP